MKKLILFISIVLSACDMKVETQESKPIPGRPMYRYNIVCIDRIQYYERFETLAPVYSTHTIPPSVKTCTE